MLLIAAVIAHACVDGQVPPDGGRTNWASGKVYRDLQYGNATPARLQTLDLYTTSAAADDGSAPAPCVIYVHGGGWRGGMKEAPWWMLSLRQHGFHVVAVGYRLSTHAKHPAQIEDVENAVRYLKTNAAEWNLDPTRILAVGASAGGHLASLLGTRNGPSSDARVVGVVNFFGPSLLWGVDGENTKMLLGCDSPSKNGTACYDKAHDASPIEHVAPDNPPFLHFHGTCDTTVPIESSQMLQDALNMSGVDSTLIIVPHVGHAKENVMRATTKGYVNEDLFHAWISQTAACGASEGLLFGGGTIEGKCESSSCTDCPTADDLLLIIGIIAGSFTCLLVLAAVVWRRRRARAERAAQASGPFTESSASSSESTVKEASTAV